MIMPAFQNALTDEEVDALIDHLRVLHESAPARGDLNIPRAVHRESVSRGRGRDDHDRDRRPDSFETEFSWEQRIGVLSQIEVILPIERADLGDPTGWKTGAGDLAVAFKRVLHHDLERGSILSVGAEVALPTGDDTHGFGAGTTVLEAQVMYDKLLPHDSFLEGGRAVPHDSALEDAASCGSRSAVPGHRTAASAAPGRRRSKCSEPRPVGGAETEWDVVPQFQVTLSARQHIMAPPGGGSR
jgi:hypothetical protein